MNKLFKCLFTAVLGIAMAVGVGVGVASGVKATEVKAGAVVNTVLWGEKFDHFGTKTPSAAGTGTGTTIYGGASISYDQSSTNTKAYNANLAGGTAPELLLAKNNTTWTISNIMSGSAKKISLDFLSNKSNFSLTCSSDSYTVDGSEKSWTLSLASGKTAPETFNLTLKNTSSDNARIDNVVLKVTEADSSKTLTSISVKTAPTKTSYVSGESFDASGLVITATYSEGNPEDIAYDTHKNEFSFNPTTITSSGNVTITYGGKQTTQAVTLATVTDITGVKSAPSSVALNSSISVNDVILNANLSNGSATTVNPTSISCDTSSAGKKIATATYSPASGVKTATFEIDVVNTATYDLTKIDGFSSWSTSYIQHVVESSKITGSTATATLDFKIASKQSSGVGSTYPCIATKTKSEVSALEFTLKETGKKISSLSLTFVQRGTNKPTFYLHKGSGINSDSLKTLKIDSVADAEVEFNYDNLNDTIFTIGYNGNNEGSNVSAGLKSITIGLSDVGSFGELDHIKVTKMPDISVYHVTETLSYTGMVVTAYDGADESTANFKDVTSEVSKSVSEGYEFQDDDIGEFNVNITYEGKNAILGLNVYAKAEYELVTEEQSDWSGNYIIVGSYTDDLSATHDVAMTSTLTNFDAVGNFKEINITSTTVEAGQESEFKVTALAGGGYSIQGKSDKFFGGPTADSNGLVTSDSALKNNIEYSGGNVLINSTASTVRHLRVENSNNETRFRYYKTGDGVQLYKLKESSKASEYADTFLAAGLCDGGVTAPSTTTWGQLAASYAELGNADKEIFRLGVASETGTNIQQCLARYDTIVSKYGKTTYTDFMNRDPQPASGVSILSRMGTDNNIVMIIAISIISVTALGGYFFIRRRKETN